MYEKKFKGFRVGISQIGIKKLFPNIIYSLNPDKFIYDIASNISGTSSNISQIKINIKELRINYNDSNIGDSQKILCIKN